MTKSLDPGAERPAAGGMRASDSDREHVAERLRTAAGDGRIDFSELDERLEAAYAAKTYAELEPLVADLPGATGHAIADASSVASQPPAPVARAMQVGGHSMDNTAIAIFGGAERKGRWVVPRSMKCFALFGGIDLDLTEAVLEDRDVTINAVAIFGGINIVLPDGVAVQTSGAGIFGGFDGLNDNGNVPGAPTIHVTGAAVFGGVDAKRKRPSRKERRSAHSWPHLTPPPPAPPLPPPPPKLPFS